MTQIKVQDLTVSLFPHQLSSVYHLERRERSKKLFTGVLDVQTHVGIFADLGGYGKTLTLVSLILRDAMSWNLEEPFMISNLKYVDPYGAVSVRRFCTSEDEKCNSTLVIVHPSVLAHWQSEFARSLLSVAVVDDTSKLVNLDPENVDVVLCVHLFYQNLVTVYPRVWKRVVYDEPIASLIPRMFALQAGFMWFVTESTAFADVYRKGRCARGTHFLKNMFGQMPSDVYQALVVRNDDSYVLQSWPLPPPVLVVHECNAEAGYDDDDFSLEVMGLGGSVEYAATPVLLDATPPQPCAICLGEPMSDPILVRCCKQKIGGRCLLQWHKQAGTCPLCREELQGKDLVLMQPEEPPISLKSRERTVLDLIRAAPAARFILFSDVRENAKTLKRLLTRAKITHATLQGHAADLKTVEHTRSGAIRVLILSSKRNGAGLDLHHMTDLILFHDVCPRVETHLVNRVNRIGRTLTDPLRIHALRS